MPPPLPFTCPAALCGNGVRDVCQLPRAAASCPQYSAIELCDGAELGEQTCQRRGFGSGTLACTATCDFDTSGCSDCMLPDARLLRCGAPPVMTRRAGSIAIAANDAEVGLAWIEGADGVAPAVLVFARLSPSLDLMSVTRIEDPWLGASAGNFSSGVSVAPLPSGWAIVGFVPGDVFLYVVDTDGQPIARTTIDPLPLQVLAYPTLAARPSGGPLAVWMTTGGLRVAVISDDGRTATAPITLPVPALNAEKFDAAFAAGAFHVVTAMGTGTNLSQIIMYRVTPDGTNAEKLEALPGVTAYAPSLAAGADDLRVVYRAANDKDFVWQPVDAGGAPLAAPVVIATAQNVPEAPRTVGLGTDTVSLLAGLGLAGELKVARVASDGTITTPAYTIAVGTVFWHRIVRRGPDVVAVWLSNIAPGIRIARVVP